MQNDTLSFRAGLSPLPAGAVQVQGDLLARLTANFDRLERDDYRPELAFKREGTFDDGWPGDWPGRNLLAWANLSRVTGREPKYWRTLVGMFPGRLNEKGYLGHAAPGFDEQQLSGHGWLTGGLLACYDVFGDERALKLAKGIVDGLYMPLKGKAATYPRRPEERPRTGGAAGILVNQLNGWRLSSDIGCAFISLEGIVKAYRQFREPDQKALIEELFEVFCQIDLLALSAQLHSSLTAARQFLMFHDLHPEPELLMKAREVYGLFRSQAVTEDYANYNWFGRPTWTEPCAVVDALMTALALWQKTGEPAYLDDAHHIYFNALGYGQKPHGGFGCDSCVGAGTPVLENKVYDITWCCNMRGGVGLAEAARHAYLASDAGLALPFYFDSTAEVTLPAGTLKLAQSSGYPERGAVTLRVDGSTLEGEIDLYLYAPGWVQPGDFTLRLNGRQVEANVSEGFIKLRRQFGAGETVELRFPNPVRSAAPVNALHNPAWHSVRRGVLVLGHTLRRGEGPSIEPEGDLELKPLRKVFGRSDRQAQTERVQVMFGEDVT